MHQNASLGPWTICEVRMVVSKTAVIPADPEDFAMLS
jgi:hypothetical protein